MLLAEDVISSNVKNINITLDDGKIEFKGISGESENKLKDLLEDLDKPQNGNSYNVNIENGRKVTVSIV